MIFNLSVYYNRPTQNLFIQTNFFGRSNLIGSDKDVYSIRFDQKIFTKALTQKELIHDINGK